MTTRQKKARARRDAAIAAMPDSLDKRVAQVRAKAADAARDRRIAELLTHPDQLSLDVTPFYTKQQAIACAARTSAAWAAWRAERNFRQSLKKAQP